MEKMYNDYMTMQKKRFTHDDTRS